MDQRDNELYFYDDLGMLQYSRDSLMRPPKGLSQKWSLCEVVALVKGCPAAGLLQHWRLWEQNHIFPAVH